MSNDPFGVCLEPKCNDEEPSKDLPSFTDMAKGFFGSAKDVLSGAVQGEGVLVTEEIYNTRISLKINDVHNAGVLWRQKLVSRKHIVLSTSGRPSENSVQNF